jgi:2-keto-4-pentenoate hydratase/2-oxohepta-3-ene-1,7-dioic acid hydratase in catechol pathway
MRIIRYQDPQGAVRYAAQQPDGSARQIVGDIFGAHEVTQEPARVEKLLAPVVPVAFLCIGLNYRRHAEEGKAPIPQYPVLFMKSPAAVQNPSDPILLPRHLRSDEVDYECELAVVIGRHCKNVPKEKALDYVLGYTCANDVSARDWQGKWGSSQWCRGKTFDTFCPLGPAFVTGDGIRDPNHLALTTRLNGSIVQQSNTRDMIFTVAEIISFLSGSTTLEAGTLIITGTPEGVGMGRTPPLYLKPGDVVEIEIEGIGTLRNPVVEEKIN